MLRKYKINETDFYHEYVKFCTKFLTIINGKTDVAITLPK